MKAIVWTKYGAPEGLQLREVPTPTPREQEVLIRVHAATVSTQTLSSAGLTFRSSMPFPCACIWVYFDRSESRF